MENNTQNITSPTAEAATGVTVSGREYKSVEALGEEILVRLWHADNSDIPYWEKIMSEHAMSEYFSEFAEQKMVAEKIENDFSKATNPHDKTVCCYLMGYMFYGSPVLYVDGRKMNEISELTEYMKRVLAMSYGDFEELCHSLVSYDEILEAGFEAFLIAKGKSEAIEQWKESLRVS